MLPAKRRRRRERGHDLLCHSRSLSPFLTRDPRHQYIQNSSLYTTLSSLSLPLLLPLSLSLPTGAFCQVNSFVLPLRTRSLTALISIEAFFFRHLPYLISLVVHCTPGLFTHTYTHLRHLSLPLIVPFPCLPCIVLLWTPWVSCSPES